MFEIVRKESPLRRLPAGLDPRQHVLFDGIRYAAETVDLSYCRVLGALQVFSRSRSEAETERPFATAFADAWALVDATNRIRPLIATLTGSNRPPEVRHFLQATNDVKELRNVFQHIQGTADKLVKKKQQVFGSITWISIEPAEPMRWFTHLIAAGSLYVEETFPMANPAAKVPAAPVDHVTLHAYTKEVRFPETVQSVKTLITLLEGPLRRQFAHLPPGGPDFYASVEFTPGEAPHPPVETNEPDG